MIIDKDDDIHKMMFHLHKQIASADSGVEDLITESEKVDVFESR